MSLEINGLAIPTDNEGYLKNLNDWSNAVAELIAKKEGIELTDNHWEIITSIQAFYQRYEVSPAMRPLVNYIAIELGEQKGNSIYLMQLFPNSPAKLISKIAGLPRPTNCL